MSAPTIGLIHATPLAIPPVRETFERLMPEVGLMHLLDEGLLRVLDDGEIGPRATDRMLRVIGLVRDAEVDLIQLTCSAYSPIVQTLQRVSSVSVLAIDDVLVAAAVERGPRIAVISTQTLTAQAIRDAATSAGVSLEIDELVFRDAFAALARGDGAEHDRLLGERIAAFADRDAIVLGQASMTRVLPTLEPSLAARVLTSPTLAVESARTIFSGARLASGR